jgi:hypothetical protein
MRIGTKNASTKIWTAIDREERKNPDTSLQKHIYSAKHMKLDLDLQVSRHATEE